MKSDNNVDLFFLGDTYYGEWHMRLRGRKGKNNVLIEKGYEHFGKNFEAILNAGDKVFANLECAITDIPESPLAGTNKKHLYSAREAETINALKKLNISALILSNNHSVDYGKAGLIDTLTALDNAGIEYIGAGRGEKEATQAKIYSFPCGNKTFKTAISGLYNYGVLSDGYGFYAKNDIPGVNRLDNAKLKTEITKCKLENEEIFFIASPHWGPNYVWRTFGQQQMGEGLVKAGADLVVGHSAHMIQELEYYNEKLILYSIGNFIMNGDGEYKRRNLPPYSFIARLNICEVDDKLVKKMLLYPIMSNNKEIDFSPRFVDHQEFNHVHMILRSHNYDMQLFDNHVILGDDEYGYYFEYPL
jgi:poly-gamma-glutamate capsule biosynthesis protein CapA/YwtB (metallophosphatase superfamily)